ncbi:class I SAM-dependent methyltransferase family protein [Candidatus Bathyarchaeota archaeon]|nr:MAG: class I SAM-dependent methyltransferase family protein [Candidatus Bathyarchaeota archaeon]
MRKQSFKSYLRKVLSEEEISELKSSLEIIGNIAILKLPEKLDSKKEVISKAILELNKNVKTVLKQSTPVNGEFRTRNFEWIAGEKQTETVYKEHGCMFKLDVSKVYFSPRLQFERLRIAQLVKPGETIINMFAGVGSFSIILAKKSKPLKVYSIDLNPTAIQYLKENIRLNKVENIVIPMLGDAKELINSQLMGVADRVLMPLPAKAYEYLPDAIKSLKNRSGWIHYYDFIYTTKDEDPKQKVVEKVSSRLDDVDFSIQNSRIVRSVGPNWYQVVLDIFVGKGSQP